MLADLLEDNAALHEIYPMTAAPGDWESGVREAMRHVEALQRGTTHAETIGDCRRVISALDGVTGPQASLPQALRQAEAAMDKPDTSREERDTLLVRQQLLRHRLRGRDSTAEAGIPRIAHLVRTDDRPDDLPLMQYLCYRSVLANCAGYHVMLHSPAVPRGARWEKLLPRLELRIATTPQFLGNHRLVAAAHQSDVWRLKQVIEHGGFYFDWDLLLLRPPEGLRSHVCVMALERKEVDYDEVLGVSAIGAEPRSAFLQAWLDAMPAVYNPRRYVSHSTVLAHRLATKLQSLVRVLDPHAFYYPGWSEEAMRWLFDPAARLPEEELQAHLAQSIGIHLFCSHANFLHWARDMTEKDIEAARGNLAALMRPYL
jgi:hypothetical protein